MTRPEPRPARPTAQGPVVRIGPIGPGHKRQEIGTNPTFLRDCHQPFGQDLSIAPRGMLDVPFHVNRGRQICVVVAPTIKIAGPATNQGKEPPS